jgi:hypothetical protein
MLHSYSNCFPIEFLKLSNLYWQKKGVIRGHAVFFLKNDPTLTLLKSFHCLTVKSYMMVFPSYVWCFVKPMNYRYIYHKALRKRATERLYERPHPVRYTPHFSPRKRAFDPKLIVSYAAALRAWEADPLVSRGRRGLAEL